MVRFRNILACGFLVLVSPTMAVSQTGKTAIEQQMTTQGYDVIYSETTWLGRLRLLAVRGDYLREVVIGPGSGEVLRDVVYEIPGLAKKIAAAQQGGNAQAAVDLGNLLGAEIQPGPQDPVAAGQEPGPDLGASGEPAAVVGGNE